MHDTLPLRPSIKSASEVSSLTSFNYNEIARIFLRFHKLKRFHDKYQIKEHKLNSQYMYFLRFHKLKRFHDKYQIKEHKLNSQYMYL